MNTHYSHELPLQRITVTVDIIEEPGNDTLALAALRDILGHLEHDGIIPVLTRLEIQPTPTT